MKLKHLPRGKKVLLEQQKLTKIGYYEVTVKTFLMVNVKNDNINC